MKRYYYFLFYYLSIYGYQRWRVITKKQRELWSWWSFVLASAWSTLHLSTPHATQDPSLHLIPHQLNSTVKLKKWVGAVWNGWAQKGKWKTVKRLIFCLVINSWKNSYKKENIRSRQSICFPEIQNRGPTCKIENHRSWASNNTGIETVVWNKRYKRIDTSSKKIGIVRLKISIFFLLILEIIWYLIVILYILLQNMYWNIYFLILLHNSFNHHIIR